MEEPSAPQWFRCADPSSDLFSVRGDHVSQYRPIAQGDIFNAIPFPIVRHPASEAEGRRKLQERLPPARAWNYDVDAVTAKLGVKLYLGMILPNTCTFYYREEGLRNPLRLVARVREAQQRSEIVPDWDANFDVLPLPNLRGDGADYVVDFYQLAVVEESFLALDGRVAAMTFEGWLTLTRRFVYFMSRAIIPWDDLAEGARQNWQQIEDDEQRHAMTNTPISQQLLAQEDRP